MKKITFLVVALCATMFANAAEYVKVTTAPEDWTGTYIIVYEADAENACVFNGLDAVNGYTDATIAEGKINATNLVECTVAAMDGGYSIKLESGDNAGKYIYGKSGDNSIKFGTAPVLNTFEITEEGVLPTSFTSVFRFNTASNQMRFRYFKSTTYAAQKIVQFYKKTETVGVKSLEAGAVEIFGANGTIYGAENGRIYTITGMDVTEQNGRLNGVYVVKINGKVQKVMVR